MKMILQSKTLQQIKNYSWYIQGALDYKENHIKKDLLTDIDKILLQIENNENNKEQLEILKDKLIFLEKGGSKNYIGVKYKSLSDNEIEKNNKFIDFFVELKAYEELRKKKFENIKFIPTGKIAKSDIEARYKEKQFFFEVKNIRISDKEQDALRKCKEYENMANRIIATTERKTHKQETCRGIKNKINYNIKSALKKFSNIQSESNKILIINYMEGFEVWVILAMKRKGQRNLFTLLGRDYFYRLEKENKIKIWTRRYF